MTTDPAISVAAGSAGPARASAAGLRRFGPPQASVVVRNAEPLLADLPLFIDGWPCAVEPGGTAEADIDVAVENGMIVIRSRAPYAGEISFANAVDAANGLAGILAGAYVCADPAAICLHAGAAEIGGGIVLVLGDSLAGKSSVSLQLAAEGCAFFGDDRIAVTAPGPAMPRPGATCLGLLPKVRLPLPPDASAKFRRFVAAHTVRAGDDAAYLGPAIPRAARFGDRRPVTAIVVLDRRDGGPAEMRDCSAASLAQILIRQGYAPHLAPAGLVDIATRIAISVETRRLVFRSSAEAARMLMNEFKGGPA